MRTVEPEKMAANPESFLADGFGAGKHRGRERQRWRLTQPDRLVSRTRRGAETRQQRPGALDAPQCLEKIEGLRLLEQRLQRCYRIWRWPSLAGHRITSPRFSVFKVRRVKLLSDACRRKNSSSTAPSTN